MNRRNWIKTAAAAGVGVVTTGAGLLSSRQVNVATMRVAGMDSHLWWGRIIQRATECFIEEHPDCGLSLDEVELCARQLDISEKSGALTGVCSTDNMQVVFDRSDPLSTKLRITAVARRPLDHIDVTILI
jgi:hypothetical protein